LAELQAQIDRFVHIYNEERPHTARGCPPMQVIDENGVTLRHLELDPSVDYQGRVRAIV
jgi:hypothetical protein